ncbi:MAG: DJ-1/PfpI family protein [Porticoccaceae bacterium]|nr:DJ-1/PfpI family protein [Porticoccaceae bacterium]
MKTVLMLLANGLEPLEMAAFSDVFGWASLLGNESIELVDVGLRTNIKTAFGLNLRANFVLDDVDLATFDALAIPGGFEPAGFYREALSEPFLDVIRSFHSQGKPIASVCVSSLALGAAGILKGRRATVYHQAKGLRKQQLQESGAIFIDRPIVVDGNCITSTGPGTAIEVALTLLARLSGEDNAQGVREKMRIPSPSAEWYQAAQL